MRTFDLVSGSRNPTRPPPTSTEEARRMGMALVMPTKEPKIRFPITAASLHKALQKPNPVPLKWKSLGRKDQKSEKGKKLVLHRYLMGFEIWDH